MSKTQSYFFATIFMVGFSLPLCSSVFDDASVVSPNGRLSAVIDIGSLELTVLFHGKPLIHISPLSLNIKEHGILGKNPRLINQKTERIDRMLRPIVPTKSTEIRDHYNELFLNLEGNYSLRIRAFNEGVAYRFETNLGAELTVIDEPISIGFFGNHKTWFPREESFLTHSERLYENPLLSKISPEMFCSLPMLVEIDQNVKVVITESDLRDYPGLYLKGTGSKSLKSFYPRVATKVEQTRDRTVEVRERADYIARTSGGRTFPWRIFAVSENDGQLLTNQLVYQLAEPLQLGDPSWIKPGKVAWDWWNANNIYGVDFRAGINTETYKYYIDFASKFGIEYIILDGGWYKLGDLFDINPDINMGELLNYAHRKNVGIILWAVWKTLDNQLHEALDQFQRWGVKGIKVDFMQRDDQWMVNYYWKIAEEAAKRKLIVDFHGSYKPAGLRRAFPNVLTREGVKGLENNKWVDYPTPEHNLTIPFIRMLAGPMDYTPGAMINAHKKNYHSFLTRPMSIGTRCHQLAMYVIFESPLQMLADSPSNYLRESECMEFLSAVPAVWDETITLEAKLSDYVVMARRRNDVWFLGAMTDGLSREFVVKLDFLESGEYRLVAWEDGINADRYASDYSRTERTIRAGDAITVKLAGGGGFVAMITKNSN